MDAVLVFDHRFYRGADGTAFSIAGYNYDLLRSRYLSVFDRLTVVSRVSDRPPRKRADEEVEGPGIRLISMGDWNGAAAFCRGCGRLTRRLTSLASGSEALVMVVPGLHSLLAMPTLLRSSKPYALEVVGDPLGVFAASSGNPLRLLPQRLWPAALRQQCARSAAVGYVTQAALQQLYPPGHSAYTTHYSSIELPNSAIVSASRRVTAVPTPLRLLTIGSMAQPYKGIDTLIDAVRICMQRGLRVSLRVVGDGRCQPELELQSRQLGLGNHVTFVGRLPPGDSVVAELDASDLFILASRTEGLPRTLIEAMARALPCLGTAVGGIPELLSSECLVAPDDPLALARRILAVSSKAEDLQTMSAQNLMAARRYRSAALQERRRELYTHLTSVTLRWLSQHGRSAHSVPWEEHGPVRPPQPRGAGRL